MFGFFETFFQDFRDSWRWSEVLWGFRMNRMVILRILSRIEFSSKFFEISHSLIQIRILKDSLENCGDFYWNFFRILRVSSRFFWRGVAGRWRHCNDSSAQQCDLATWQLLPSERASIQIDSSIRVPENNNDNWYTKAEKLTGCLGRYIALSWWRSASLNKPTNPSMNQLQIENFILQLADSLSNLMQATTSILFLLLKYSSVASRIHKLLKLVQLWREAYRPHQKKKFKRPLAISRRENLQESLRIQLLTLMM